MAHVPAASTCFDQISVCNAFTSHCDICSHRITQPDINLLHPCSCGPFHGYCISNLELHTRELHAKDTHAATTNPQLRCPRCRHLVTAVAYDFRHDLPRASRNPFSPVPPALSPNLQPAHTTVLPTAIHDARPTATPHPSPLTKWSPYPKPTLSDLHGSYPLTPTSLLYTPHQEHISTPHLYVSQQNRIHTSPHQQSSQTDMTPSAPPAPCEEQPVPFDIDDCFPPPAQEFTPGTPATRNSRNRKPVTFQHRHQSHLGPQSSSARLERILDLPTPHDKVPPPPIVKNHQRRPETHVQCSSTRKNSPKTVVVCQQVNEEDVRNGVYGDDVYKAYVEGKATVLGTGGPSSRRTGSSKDMSVKVDMDVHVYHHYYRKPHVRPGEAVQDQRMGREKQKRKPSTFDKTWWKSPRCSSRLEAREAYVHVARSRSRRGNSRKP